MKNSTFFLWVRKNQGKRSRVIRPHQKMRHEQGNRMRSSDFAQRNCSLHKVSAKVHQKIKKTHITSTRQGGCGTLGRELLVLLHVGYCVHNWFITIYFLLLLLISKSHFLTQRLNNRVSHIIHTHIGLFCVRTKRLTHTALPHP